MKRKQVINLLNELLENRPLLAPHLKIDAPADQTFYTSGQECGIMNTLGLIFPIRRTTIEEIIRHLEKP